MTKLEKCTFWKAYFECCVVPSLKQVGMKLEDFSENINKYEHCMQCHLEILEKVLKDNFVFFKPRWDSFISELTYCLTKKY